ncbi:MAG TPA: PP2C family protein-serine/threonine phosphatase [Thermoanaerobaculia bacterium]|nr:PP2C family protein-serine/threonine phosphatase [Thermoanaerobaculia bacterium]
MVPVDEAARRELPPEPGRPGIGRLLLRYGPVSALIGIGVTVFINLGSRQALQPQSLASGALLGFALCSGSLLAERLLVPWAPSREGVVRTALRAFSYFVGGVLGSLAAIWLSASVLRVQVLARESDRLYTLAVFGGLSAAVGLTFATFGRLRYRLERSVAELKEREFAAKELETAREIQQRLLPAPDSSGPGYRVAARNRAARVVGGDFYDVFRLGDGALGVAVADVAGKGLGASLIMASVKAVLPLVAADRGVAAALEELNRRLHRELGPREFVALAFARFEPASGRLELANAGLPDPLLVSPGAVPRAVEVPGPRLPLGVRPDLRYLSVTLEVAAGERLLLYTDGLAEARRGDDSLGYEALARLVAGVNRADPGAWVDELLREVAAFSGGALDDDCTALVLERVACGAGAASPTDARTA